MNNALMMQSLYSSNVYWIEKPEYLDVARKVTDEYLDKSRKEKKESNPIYPAYMTDHMDHPDLYPMMDYINRTGYDILESQGFDMNGWNIICKEFWCQEHEKYSGHEEHVHGFGNQLTGMYFLDVPDGSCQFVVYDPRPAKRQINMYEKDPTALTNASIIAYYTPQPGTLYLTNSWLPHGFTRNSNDKSFKFIHFNLGVGRIENYTQSEPIII
jgi:hypothetical protein